MIQSIELKRFQIHESKIFRFFKGINIISGTSNSGKTAILRAINWVYSNKPKSTKTILKHNEKEITVKINNVIRKRNQYENSYELDNIVFEAVNDKVPKQILDSLPKIDYQKQHDPLFLIEMGNAEQSHFLNKLLKLSLMDKMQMKIEKEKQDIRKNLNNLKIEELKTNINKLSLVPKARLILDEIVMLESIKEPSNIEEYKRYRSLETKRPIIEQIEKLKEPIMPERIEEYKNMKERLSLLKKQLEEIKPKICPVCGQIVKDTK